MLPFPTWRELARRLPRCLLGLGAFGVGIACMLRSELGASPWDVFHSGVSDHTGIPVGRVIVLTGLLIMSLWIPLRQRFGIGTILNALEIGLVADPVLHALPITHHLAARIAYLVGGILVIAIGSGLYIGSGLGAGPRDGLMLGLHQRFGWPIGRARTGIELVTLACGLLLGGSAGIGTLLFAVAIGPLAARFLPIFSLPPLPRPDQALAPT